MAKCVLSAIQKLTLLTMWLFAASAGQPIIRCAGKHTKAVRPKDVFAKPIRSLTPLDDIGELCQAVKKAHKNSSGKHAHSVKRLLLNWMTLWSAAIVRCHIIKNAGLQIKDARPSAARDQSRELTLETIPLSVQRQSMKCVRKTQVYLRKISRCIAPNAVHTWKLAAHFAANAAHRPSKQNTLNLQMR